MKSSIVLKFRDLIIGFKILNGIELKIKYMGLISHSIQVWYIYLHEHHKKSTTQVGKYTSSMDGMGFTNFLGE